MFRVMFVLLWATTLLATETKISEWKTAPVTTLPPVAFGDSTVKTADLLGQVKIEWSRLNLINLNQKPLRGAELSFPTDAQRAYGLAATSLTTDGNTMATLEVTGSRPLIVYANGKELTKATAADSGAYKARSEITLDRTRTDVLVATVSQNSDSGAWSISAIVTQDSASVATITSGASMLKRPAHMRYDAELENLSSLLLSPDGKYLIFQRTIREGEEYKSKSWYEIWDTDQSKLFHVFDKSGVSDFDFSKDGRKLYYRASTDDGSEVWSFGMGNRQTTRLAKAVKNLDGFKVQTGEGSIVYSVTKEKPENKSGYDLFRELEDRVTTYNDRRELFVADLKSGLTRQLTKAGEFELDKWSVSPSGERVLLIKHIPKFGRPYVTQEFWTVELASGVIKKVLTRNLIEYPQNICWIDENRIAYSAGSHDAAPEDTVYHNVAQLVVCVVDLRTGENKILTADQKFSVADEEGGSNIFYNPRDKSLYCYVIQNGGRHFAKVSLDSKSVTFRPYKSDFEYTDEPTFADNGSKVAYIASDYNTPKAVFVNSTAEKKLFDPNQDVVADWEFGSMEPWSFTNRLGEEIDGWFYKPADYTPTKKWPLIVYYYAGVTPRDVRFSVQYQLWLANGYCVYVLNPVGALGKGQKFADYHAGDWGTEATQDVIEGTEKVLAAHPFIDGVRVGCYGGSYGGFITLDLVTKTDMFKTAIDMYGISNITNYFGGGIWGYWYADIASPGKFPWSDKDVYVDKSPIYNADKIKTPMLILHGGIDDNVPWIESDQMFVALKLLGQDVVYARFQDETHNINTKYKNLIEHRQMMLEWFDKYLKDQPGAWDSRMSSYGE